MPAFEVSRQVDTNDWGVASFASVRVLGSKEPLERRCPPVPFRRPTRIELQVNRLRIAPRTLEPCTIEAFFNLKSTREGSPAAFTRN